MKNLIVIFLLLTLISCRTLTINKIEYSNIHLDSTLVITDSKIDSIILPYRLELEKDMNIVLCYSKESLFNGKPESTLTNFCADLLLAESDSICLRYPNVHIEIAMINTGGLRVPIPKGQVKTQVMFELMPFENELVFLKLSGTELKTFIDHIASRGGDGISGMRFGIKDKKSINAEVQGKPIDNSKYYWLALSDYLANGGDGNEQLKSIKDICIFCFQRFQFGSHWNFYVRMGQMIKLHRDRYQIKLITYMSVNDR